MTVRELMETLEDFDEDMEVVLGMQQNYGSNWAYSICEVEEYDVKDYDSGEKESNVVISLGRQFGTVKYGG